MTCVALVIVPETFVMTFNIVFVFECFLMFLDMMFLAFAHFGTSINFNKVVYCNFQVLNE